MARKKAVQPQTIEDVIALGNDAETFLTSPAFVLACDTLEEKYIYSWMGSAPDNADARENFYYSLKALSEIKLELQYMINGRKMANT